MKPFIKWSGSLENEMDVILPFIPKDIRNYFEPFVGSGACFFAINAKRYFINDICEELINIYKILGSTNQKMMSDFKCMVRAWDKIDKFFEENKDELYDLKFKYDVGKYNDYLCFVEAVKLFVQKCDYDKIFDRKMSASQEDFHIEIIHSIIESITSMEGEAIEEQMVLGNLKTGLKEGLYQYIQEIYNNKATKNSLQCASLLFLMNYATKSKFLLDDLKEFRVEYAGKRFNNVSLDEVADMIESCEFSKKFERTFIGCQDFIRFFGHKRPRKGDFIFLDPPDDGREGVYGTNRFYETDHMRLASYLLSENIDAKWMLIAKKSDLTENLYGDKGLTIKEIKGKRNYLIIMNYQ